MDVMPTIHLVLLGSFLLVTILLLASTSSGLNRAADVSLYWRDVRAHSLPLAPAIFVSIMALLTTASIVVDLGIHPFLPAGYLTGGMIWLVASVLTAAVVVTDHGVIVHKKDVRHRIAWRQVVDYFRFENDYRQGYVLFYADRKRGRQRVEIDVPARHRVQFDQLLSQYLDSRLEPMPQKTYGDSTTDQ